MLLCFTPFWPRKVFMGMLYFPIVGETCINTGNHVNQVQCKSECHKLRNDTGQMSLISSSALLRFQINHSYFLVLNLLQFLYLGPLCACWSSLPIFKEQTFCGSQHCLFFLVSQFLVLEENCFLVTTFPSVFILGSSPSCRLVQRESTSRSSRDNRYT